MEAKGLKVVVMGATGAIGRVCFDQNYSDCNSGSVAEAGFPSAWAFDGHFVRRCGRSSLRFVSEGASAD